MSIGADLLKSVSAKTTSEGDFHVEMYYVGHWHLACYSWQDETVQFASVVILH